MGLLDYFRRRRERESAIPAPKHPAPEEPNEPGGGAADRSIDPGAAGESIAAAIFQAKRQMGPDSIHDAVHQAFTASKAAESGGVAGGVDYGRLMRLQDSVLAVMKEHGIDPMRPDPSRFMDPEVQRALQQAVNQHGFGADG